MSRAQFDTDQAIESAMQVFWKQGYSGASMQNITKATGLKPGSIYLAFGNKDGLYHASLTRYAKQSLDSINTLIDSAENVGLGICTLLEHLIEETGNENFHSCFLVRSRLELPHVNPLHQYTGELLLQVEHCFAEKLSTQFTAKQSKIYASTLMLHIFGARVYGYHQDCKSTLNNTLQASLPWLPWTEFSNSKH